MLIKKFENFNKNDLTKVYSCTQFFDEDYGWMINLHLPSGHKPYKIIFDIKESENTYRKLKFLKDKGYISHKVDSSGVTFNNYNVYSYKNDNHELCIMLLKDEWFLVSLYNGEYKRYLVDQTDQLIEFLENLPEVRCYNNNNSYNRYI